MIKAAITLAHRPVVLDGAAVGDRDAAETPTRVCCTSVQTGLVAHQTAGSCNHKAGQCGADIDSATKAACGIVGHAAVAIQPDAAGNIPILNGYGSCPARCAVPLNSAAGQHSHFALQDDTERVQRRIALAEAWATDTGLHLHAGGVRQAAHR